jgi:hypothetical protein
MGMSGLGRAADLARRVAEVAVSVARTRRGAVDTPRLLTFIVTFRCNRPVRDVRRSRSYALYRDRRLNVTVFRRF